jgi:hypothetical protein
MAYTVELAQGPVVVVGYRGSPRKRGVFGTLKCMIRQQIEVSRQRTELAKSASVATGRETGCRC